MISDLQRARDPNTSSEDLAFLASSSDKGVRWGVVQNPNTPSSVLAALAKDPNAGVRWLVARHLNTPSETLILMALGDEHEEIRSKALSRIEVLDLFD